MNRYKSPYREAGMVGTMVTRQPARRKEKPVVFMFSKVPGMGHDWPKAVGDSARERYANSAACRRCGQPLFAVESKKCTGRKK